MDQFFTAVSADLPFFPPDEELKAVQIMHSAIQATPNSYAVLHVQADFLRKKGKPDWALKLAKQAVNCAPSEFVTWAKLTECYIEVGDWESALFTLNSCPMFTYNERDLHRMPAPSRSHLPVKTFVLESGLLDEESAKDNEADVALLRLPAPALRGTFAQAYTLLASLVSKIGWDELLRCRSAVFVMEEEYRAQKSIGRSDDVVSCRSEPKEVGRSGANTSTIAIFPSQNDGETPQADALASADPRTDGSREVSLSQQGLASHTNASTQSIPIIKISTDSDHERERANLRQYASESIIEETDQETASGAAGNGAGASEAANGDASVVEITPPPLERPAQAGTHSRTDSLTANTAAMADAVDAAASQSPHFDNDSPLGTSGTATFSFTNKRLCERWLDNLFMVLYEDLRVYTIWRAELAHYRSQSLPYRKTGTEWEILGELALRLHHQEEAKDAFQRCIEAKFSAKAYLRLLETYAETRDVQKSLWASLRLTTYHHRWYMEGSYPGAVASNLFKLIKSDGLAKVSYTLVSMSPPAPILKLMQNYFAYAQTFKVPGFDW